MKALIRTVKPIGNTGHIILEKSMIGDKVVVLPEEYKYAVQNLCDQNVQKLRILRDLVSEDELIQIKKELGRNLRKSPSSYASAMVFKRLKDFYYPNLEILREDEIEMVLGYLDDKDLADRVRGKLGK